MYSNTVGIHKHGYLLVDTGEINSDLQILTQGNLFGGWGTKLFILLSYKNIFKSVCAVMIFK